MNEKFTEEITISSGRLKGVILTETKTLAWLGIPYAKPPVNQFQWKAPREVEPWDDVVLAQQFQKSSVQFVQGKLLGSEDCLYLNAWRPDHTGTDLPVFVFLHGGGNTSGSGQDFLGDRLACETNSIIVTINYRLGAMGFFRHPALQTGNPLDDSGNYGLLDIIHALKWVQKNISAFGGNPDNVTLAGQSAGARNALAAYISPLSKGLFHKLFIMSGGLTTATPEQGEEKANDLLAELVVKSEIAINHEAAQKWISSQSADTISEFLRLQKAEQFAEIIGETGLRMSPFPHLFEDGNVIPKGGFETLSGQKAPCIPIILGSTASEFSGFALMDPYFLPHVMSGQLDSNSGLRMLYKTAVQYGSELYASFNVEQAAEKLLLSNPELPIYSYRFRWGLSEGVIDPSMQFLLGATHGADIPFYTGDFSVVQQNFPEGIITKENKPGRLELSSIIRRYLKEFMYLGDPNMEELPQWKKWTLDPQSSEILTLDADLEHAIVRMQKKLTTNQILSRLKQDSTLSNEQLHWLTSNLFAGRFFWTK